MSTEHHVRFQMDARFVSEGVPDAQVLWICLHGYAQLAPYFIKKFSSLFASHQVIVPEGLHRFYMNDGSGRVVASWMTKEDRECDIKNYLAYLDEVLKSVLNQRKSAPNEIRILGFSQGVATACRFYAHTKLPISRLLLWAGALPPDLDLRAMRIKKTHAQIILLTGDEDPYMKEGAYDSSEQVLNELHIPFEQRSFTGGHEIKEEVLKSLID